MRTELLKLPEWMKHVSPNPIHQNKIKPPLRHHSVTKNIGEEQYRDHQLRFMYEKGGMNHYEIDKNAKQE